MGGSFVHRRPDGWLSAKVTSLRRESARGSQVEEKRSTLMWARVAIAGMVVTTPHPPWASESELKARRERSLMEDNPASG